MTDKRKQGFRTIENNMEEMEEKLRKHRRGVVVRIAVVVSILAIAFLSTTIYFQLKKYVDYEVRARIEQTDSEATQYEVLGGNILRYNNDGAYYADLSNNLIWNQAFEMQNPIVDRCGNYVTIADRQGTQIYIMNTTSVQGAIETNKPIHSVCVANQGTVAVLTQESGVSYLELYNKTGENLASGEIHIENSGYPLDIELSDDANKLAVAILDINHGKAQTSVVFYNFGSVGQNEIDNMVGTYTYTDTIIPEIEFTTNDRMVAFGDSRVIVFEGTQRPEELYEIPLDKEVKSIFYDEEYFGMTFINGKSGNSYKMQIYDMKGQLRLEQEFKMNYEKIEFLDNHEICILGKTACTIYTLRGVPKFTYTFDGEIHKVLSGRNSRNYTLILDKTMEKIRLI